MGLIEGTAAWGCRLTGALAATTAVLLATASPSVADDGGIIQWSDTFVGVRTGSSYQEPANPTNVEKSILQFQHVSGWTYGQNFINIDVLLGWYETDEAHKDGDDPAKEIYAVMREKLSSSKIFGVTYGGIIRDVGLTIGGDLSYKNDAFNARVRKFVVGPTVDFDVPGFFSVGLLLGTEHNHNGLGKNFGIPGVDDSVDFDPTWRIEAAWGIPVPIDIGVPMTWKGFMNVVGPKGKDGFGNETVTEVLLNTALMFDIGAPMGGENFIYVGVGYEWWKNKFGNDPDITTIGTEASGPELVLEIHF